MRLIAVVDHFFMATFSQFWQKICISIKLSKKTRGTPRQTCKSFEAYSLRNIALYIFFGRQMLSIGIFSHFSLDSYLNFFVNKSHHGDNLYFHVISTFSKTKFGSQAFALRLKILTRATFDPWAASLTPLL